MTKKRKKTKKNKGRAPLKKLTGIKMVVKEVQLFLKKITNNDDVMIFDKLEQHILYSFYFRLSTPFAEEGQQIPSRELKDMGKLLHRRLHVPVKKFADRNYSLRELNMLNCYHRVMNRKEISLERRLELWKYLGDIAKFELSDEDLFDAVWLHFFKTIMVRSDLTNKIYSLDIVHMYMGESNPVIHYNSRMGVYHAVKKQVRIDGQNRIVYRLILPRLNGPKYLSYRNEDFKKKFDAEKDELPVYIQSHALKRMKERLDLLDDEALTFNLVVNLFLSVHFCKIDSYILIPYYLQEVVVGYFFCQVVDNKFIIRTFLFITHFSTPEGYRLKGICGLGKNDVPYWKLDRLSTFMNVDAAQYPRLTEMFEKAGCGDLFKLKNEEFTAEAMQNANLDGLREFVMRGKMEIEEPETEE